MRAFGVKCSRRACRHLPAPAAGMVVFSSMAAEAAKAEGKAVILVRPETSPDDIHGMAVAQGIVTTRGGMTSHAAVVARGMGKTLYHRGPRASASILQNAPCVRARSRCAKAIC